MRFVSHDGDARNFSSSPFRYGNFRFIIHLLCQPYRGHKINNIKTDVQRKCGS